jgi:hypothetical protein
LIRRTRSRGANLRAFARSEPEKPDNADCAETSEVCPGDARASRRCHLDQTFRTTNCRG